MSSIAPNDYQDRWISKTINVDGSVTFFWDKGSDNVGVEFKMYQNDEELNITQNFKKMSTSYPFNKGDIIKWVFKPIQLGNSGYIPGSHGTVFLNIASIPGESSGCEHYAGNLSVTAVPRSLIIGSRGTIAPIKVTVTISGINTQNKISLANIKITYPNYLSLNTHTKGGFMQGSNETTSTDSSGYSRVYWIENSFNDSKYGTLILIFQIEDPSLVSIHPIEIAVEIVEIRDIKNNIIDIAPNLIQNSIEIERK
jgi:hypothetical protein